jgi:hypothetical protein
MSLTEDDKLWITALLEQKIENFRAALLAKLHEWDSLPDRLNNEKRPSA